MTAILSKILAEKQAKMPGGLYHKTQVNLCYNSNRIEGSKISEEETRYIFETKTVGFQGDGALPIDDIIETANHFVAFDYMLESIDEDLSNEIIKEFHRILKNATAQANSEWFALGDWKKIPNEVGGIETTLPQNVEEEMCKLNEWYLNLKEKTIENIVEYHWRFEKIHPFQDGNGRVGRLVMFRECLKHNIVPFIIEDQYKRYYYRGLAEFDRAREYLIDTCLSAQDVYREWVRYFYSELVN
ncbi:MAG: Fic family protein [Chitinivibrionia bacterium]|nr:Fic family protein [Chitinivibrionia bacterium]